MLPYMGETCSMPFYVFDRDLSMVPTQESRLLNLILFVCIVYYSISIKLLFLNSVI